MIEKLNRNFFQYSIISLLIILLSVAPIFRGLYFRENYILSFIFVALLFLISIPILIDNSKKQFNKLNYIDLGMIGLSFAYFVSFFSGVSKMHSLDGVLKYACAMLIYFVVSNISREDKNRVIFLYGFSFVGFFVALLSMLGATDIIKLAGVFGWGERLTGLYQYPNSSASVFGAAFLLSILLIIRVNRSVDRYIFMCFSTTIMLAFLSTKSRGGMLFLGLAWIVAITLLYSKDKFYLIAYSGVSTIVSMVFYSKIYESFEQKSGFLLLYVLAISVTLITTFLIEHLRKLVTDISDKRVNLLLYSLLGIFIGACIAVYNMTIPLVLSDEIVSRTYEIYELSPNTKYELQIKGRAQNDIDTVGVTINSVDNARVRTELYNSKESLSIEDTKTVQFETIDSTRYITIDFIKTGSSQIQIDSCFVVDTNLNKIVKKLKLKYRFIPDDIAKKIDAINLKTENSTERFIFVKDGIKIFKDYFLFGAGGRGWANLYTKYQSYVYVSSEAHNYYLQTAIEAGVFGLFFTVFIIICSIYVLYKAYLLSVEKGRIEIICLLAFVFILFGHAVIDFDFSLYAILLLSFSSLGIVSAISNEHSLLVINSNIKKVTNLLLIIVSIAVLYISSTMYIGMLDGNYAAKAVNKDIEKAKVLYEKAIKNGYYNSAYLIDYAQIFMFEAEKTEDNNKIKKAYSYLKRTEELDPYNLSYYQVMLQFYLKYGYLEDAQTILDRAIEINPLNPRHYEIKANIDHDIMNQLMSMKKYEQSKKYALHIVKIKEQYQMALDNTITPFELTERTNSIIKVAENSIDILENRLQGK